MAQNLGKSILTLGVDGSQMTAGMKKAQGDMARTGKAAKDLNTNLRFVRGGAGQLGHQIQDMAVQAQMGTDALVIFGQQGSQIAAIFGPGGAMLGAVLAIGAALAGPLYKAITGTSTVLADLAEEARGASGAFAELTYLEQQMRKEQVGAAARLQLDELATQRERLTDAQKRHNSAIRELNLRQRNGKGITEELSKTIEDQRNAAREAGIAIHNLRESLASLFQQVDPDAGIKGALADINEQIANLGKSDLEQTLEAFRKTGASEELVQELQRRMQLLEIMRGEIEAEKGIADARDKLAAERVENERKETEQKAKEAEKRKKAAQDLADAEADALRVVTDAQEKRFKDDAKREAKKLADEKKQKEVAIGNLKDNLMALDSNNKKVFAMQKAYRMAEATMAAFQGYNQAIGAYPPPLGQILGAATFALGMANVAQIKGQSFEGGGFTGYGARAGGLDGKGGRMAMVHPNETIIDHRKGGAAGITIVNNVDARGAGADVDQKIKAAMTQTSQQTIMTIQDMKRRGRF